MIFLQGVPTDINSSFLRGTKKAPEKILQALKSDSSNMYNELGSQIKLGENLINTGNLKLKESKEDFKTIVEKSAKKIKNNQKLISLGGDHFVTYPLIKAFSKFYKNLTIIHFDAHSDLYDNFDNNPFSHASPFARIMEENLAKRLIQVGIRTLNEHQIQQVQRFGVEVFSPHEVKKVLKLHIDSPLYISIDLDALDPAFAPGISHYEPGGLSVRDVVKILHSLKADVVGADIVEFNPKKDINNQTAMVCAKFLKEIFGAMQKEVK